MKNKKKHMFMLLTLVFVVSLQLPVMASPPREVTATQYVPIQPLWQNVNSATARLTFSGTTAHCSATIVGLSGTTRITATMRLERVSGNSATTVATWTQTVNGSRLVRCGLFIHTYFSCVLQSSKKNRSELQCLQE